MPGTEPDAVPMPESISDIAAGQLIRRDVFGVVGGQRDGEGESGVTRMNECSEVVTASVRQAGPQRGAAARRSASSDL